MKTLVIHPDDPSTEFLKEIYIGKGWTINNDLNGSKKKVIEQIKEHDRIIMLGHGHPGGLFYTPINSTLVYLLKEKQCICIWCNADKFVEKYELNGFYTGMFISEVTEAAHFGITISQEGIDRSNRDFAFDMRLWIRHDDPKTICEGIKSTYIGVYSVYQFNNDRLYYREEDEELDPAGGHGLYSHI